MSALRDFRIVELSESVAGEYCGKLLSDFGAQVIKVERPDTGSPTRHLGPFGAEGLQGNEASGLFAYLNTNKASVALDLSGPDGVAALSRLLDRADAVIDDHAPGWLAGVGINPDTFADDRPSQVLCTITPFGQSAPPERRHATALTVLHASGWGYHTPSGADPDRPPLKGPGRFLSEYESGLEAAMCVAACLYGREVTASGRFIDVSAQAVMASRIDYVLGQMVAGDMDVGTARTMLDLGGPSGIFPARRGFVYLWMSAPGHWEALRTLLGEPVWMQDFPGNWLERGVTAERIALCRGHIRDWLATQDKDEVSAAAQTLGLTIVPLNDPEDLLRSPQFDHRKFFVQVDHPRLGALVHPTVPYRFSHTPARIDRPAPLLGEAGRAA